MPSKLITALQPRAQLVAETLATRLPRPGAWAGYHRDEPLVGVLARAGEIEWHRHGDPAAGMTFGFLSVRGMTANVVGDDRVIASDVLEHSEKLYHFDKPIHYSETLKHTFSRTTTVEEATERAWHVAAKASLSVEYAGIKGAVEASTQYGEKLAQKSSEAVTVSDEVTKTIEVNGPVEIRWIVERATDTLLRTYDAAPDLDFKLYFRTGDEAWEWSSYRDVFVAACRGEAPVDQSYSIFASSSDSHDLFENSPVSDEDIALLEASLTSPVRFSAQYEIVTRERNEAL